MVGGLTTFILFCFSLISLSPNRIERKYNRGQKPQCSLHSTPRNPVQFSGPVQRFLRWPILPGFLKQNQLFLLDVVPLSNNSLHSANYYVSLLTYVFSSYMIHLWVSHTAQNNTTRQLCGSIHGTLKALIRKIILLCLNFLWSLNIYDALIHYVNNYFLRTYYILSTVIDTIYIVMNKTDCHDKALVPLQNLNSQASKH